MTVLDVVIASTITVALLAAFVEAVKNFIFSIPRMLFSYAESRLTLSVTFDNKAYGFDMVKAWLDSQPKAETARHVKMIWNNERGKYVIAPGYGNHWFWHLGVPIRITYGSIAPDKDKKHSWGDVEATESYTVKVYSGDHQRLQAFMDEMLIFRRTEEKKFWIYTWDGYWQQSASPARRRPMNTVYMSDKLKADTIADMQKFIDSEEWYAARGIPYRRGYLFYGPPGTGKTTFSVALASHLNRNVYCMNLSSVGGDISLVKAFSLAPENAVILLEDIDAFDATRRREDDDDEEETPVEGSFDHPNSGGADPIKTIGGITISGLLNAVDGVVATEGRILIMTTNHIDKLDPALIRSGRIDSRIEIGYLEPKSVVEMFKVFYPCSEQAEKIREYANIRSMSASNWQELFIRHHDAGNRLFDEVIDPSLAKE